MDVIDRIRRFNRNHTQRLGLMRQRFLEAGLSYVEARVLFELAEKRDWTARALAAHLALNEGYFSRLVGRLNSHGFVKKEQSMRDGRVHVLSLTQNGQEAANHLIAHARDQIEGWLAPLTDAQAHGVASKMDAIDQALSGPAPAVILRDMSTGDAGWLIQQHAECYAESDGFDASFEALVAEILSGFLRGHDTSRERGWIACRGAERLGSIFCVKGDSADIAKLRLFFLVPAARGLGLGQTLLTQCIDFARRAGYRHLVLGTHASHEAACRLYKKQGFQMIDSYPVIAFGQTMEEQHWKLDLV